VESFYRLVSEHDFSAARGLWSSTMQASYDPETNIDHRFAHTQHITAQRAVVVSETSNQATVAVTVVETLSDGRQQVFSGSWQLVKMGNSWLLNWPNLH
jgi:hypothetical protein